MNAKRIVLVISAVVIGLGLTGLVGCKKKEQPVPAPKKATKTATPAKAPSMEDMTKKTTTAAKEAEKTATTAAEDVKKTATAAATDANKAVTAAVEQTMCPVLEAKIDKNVFVEYKGKKVYFCCADCKAKFEADPEKYIAKLPQFQK
jgi:YHS domain-containing protein